MPIYEYICDECRRPSEILLKGRKEKPRCPHCGSIRLQRQFSTFAAHQGGSSTPAACPAGPDAACRSAGKCPLA